MTINDGLLNSYIPFYYKYDITKKNIYISNDIYITKHKKTSHYYLIVGN